MTAAKRTVALLLLLCDPRCALDDPATLPRTRGRWLQLLEMASAHGVLGIVMQNLAPHRSLVPPDAWQLAERRWRADLVKSMWLRQFEKRLLDAMWDAGVPAVTIKGTDFADYLYPQPVLRPTRDIDLLLLKEHWQQAGAILESLGYDATETGPNSRYTAEQYGEQTWQHRQRPEISCELHWNLIRSPSLRGRASVGYHDLVQLNWSPSDTRPPFTPAARLVIAAVHGAFGHQFDRLLLLCDVREACRVVVAQGDSAELVDLVALSGTGAAVDVGVAMVARLFKDTAAKDIRGRLGRKTSHWIDRHLLSAKLLAQAAPHTGPVRRTLLREWLKRAA
ncbi:MAG: nucleotidyltransferase family protein [Planctomycetia bacterium]|nr:nucleotidyltransferase family protein [Planctomycetia bacterium]